MDDQRFDALTSMIVNRRFGLGLAVAALLGVAPGGGSLAKKKPKKCTPKCATCKRCVKGKCKPKSNGSACGGGKTCQDGACACPNGNIVCSGTCVNLGTDAANCGECGRACGPNEFCFAAFCFQNV